VWVLSRHPLTDYQTIEFGECDSWECFARKGALLLSGTCGATPFRLVASHLQGEEGESFTAENQAIRDRQMLEIRDRLLTPHLEPKVPFIVCGDLNTPRLYDSCHAAETPSYRKMLATFGVENGADVRITLAASKQENQLAMDDSGRHNELDYILLRSNGFEISAERTRHVFKRPGWDPKDQRTDLSYRYAVSAKLTFGTSGWG
jgi:endonuclease/exonuclease/phosphatase family metal-dependent hydrolase